MWVRFAYPPSIVVDVLGERFSASVLGRIDYHMRREMTLTHSRGRELYGFVDFVRLSSLLVVRRLGSLDLALRIHGGDDMGLDVHRRLSSNDRDERGLRWLIEDWGTIHGCLRLCTLDVNVITYYGSGAECIDFRVIVSRSQEIEGDYRVIGIRPQETATQYRSFVQLDHAMPWRTLNKMMTDNTSQGDIIKKLEADNKRKSDDTARNNQNQQSNKRQNTGRAYAAGNSDGKPYGGPRPLCSKCNYHHDGPCAPKCHKCHRFGHLGRDCKNPPNVNTGANKRAACFKCGAQGHFRKDCPKWKNNNNRGNQAGNAEAQAKVYAVGNARANPDNNVITGTFLLNNRYASILFDTGADRSFVSTAFSS
ncbi:putative reverse transcriptase domain-containing protein [Tanacetum coccineum]|uniref:Reverse transcriptase domain-containing protein n=1 Tax=Tanacetum coccineum TaxID=301880 RepID=A0ABQ5HYM0_9ASTR